MIAEEVLQSFKGKRVLVTGGTGLIGRQVVDILAHAGAEVTSISLQPALKEWEGLVGWAPHHNLHHNIEDLTDVSKVGYEGHMWHKDYVFHLAGWKGSVVATKERPADFFVPILQVNTNVLEACRRNEVPHVVYTSSIGAYAEASPDGILREQDDDWSKPPMDFYPGWAKRMGELQIRAYREQYGLKNFAVVRLTNCYGVGDTFRDDAMVIPALMTRIKRGDDPVTIWGDGSAVRDFLYSRDAAEGIILAAYHGTGDGFVNLGSGLPFSIRDVVDALDFMTAFPHVFDPSAPQGYPKRVMDITLARARLGWAPETSLRDGLEKTWEWYKRQP